MMTGTRKSTILATAAIAVPFLSCQIVAGEILHGGVGGNESLTYSNWGRGLTDAFEATSDQTDLIKAEEEQSEGVGSIRNAEVEDEDKDEEDYNYPNEDEDEDDYKDDYEDDSEDDYEDKDDYHYQDNKAIWDIWYELQCGDVLAPRPLHNHTIWMDLRLAYERAVGAKHSTLSSSPSSLQGDDGFAVPHQIVQVEGKGRGIVAAEPIQAGQWIWTSRKTARFLDAPSYGRFLQSVPVDLACDVMMWSYVQEMGGWSEKDFLISVDLDDGSYCNAAYGGPSNTRVAEDTGCDSKECRFHFFATEDIAVGEEIVCNYSSFSDGSGWAKFGL